MVPFHTHSDIRRDTVRFPRLESARAWRIIGSARACLICYTVLSSPVWKPKHGREFRCSSSTKATCRFSFFLCTSDILLALAASFLKRGNERYFSKRFSSSSWRNDFPSSYASAGSRAIPRATHPIRRQTLASWGPGSSFVRPSGEGLSHPRPDVLEKHLWLHRKYDAAIGRAVRAGILFTDLFFGP
jgi:hypothetical protein